MGVAAGRRRFRVAIERNTPTTNSLNEKVESWAQFAAGGAEVMFGALQERREAAQTAPNQTAVFRVLDDSLMRQVTVKDRIQFDGSAWNIVGIAPSKSNRREFTAVRKAG